MSTPVIYANTDYISGKHTFKTILNGANLSLNSLVTSPTCNVMTLFNTNVGVGTTNPTKTLHVVGDVLTTGTITASNISVIGDFVTLNTVTSNTEQIVVTNAGTGPALKVTQTGAQPVAEFYDNESGLAMTIANNGNVGIGTTNPLANLHVNGIMRTSQPHCDVCNPNNPAAYGIYIFSTVITNTGNYYNSTTGKFTCPYSGIYHITFQIRRDGIVSGTYNHAFVYINDIMVPRLSGLATTTTNYVTISASGSIYLSAGSTISIVNQSSGGTSAGDNQSGMTVYYLG